MTEIITDWTLWDNRAYFTLEEASALLCGEPTYSRSNKMHEMKDLIVEKLGRYRCDIPDHKKGHKNNSPFTGGYVNPSEVPGECKLSRETLAAFAEGNKISSPFLFPEERENLEVTASEKATAAILQAIMDKKGKHFAEELEAAVCVWDALFKKSAIRDNKGYKDQIAAWLKKNRHDLSAKAISRIATIVNPRKDGGAPKIGGSCKNNLPPRFNSQNTRQLRLS